MTDKLIDLRPPASCAGLLCDVFGYPSRAEASRLGVLDWYTYQPQRYDDPAAPVTGSSPFYLLPEEPGQIRRHARYPYFSTPDAALAYMVEHRICGHVQRFVVTSDLVHKTKLMHFGRDDSLMVENYPWLTAGVARCVERPEAKDAGTAHVSPLSPSTPVTYLEPA